MSTKSEENKTTPSGKGLGAASCYAKEIKIMRTMKMAKVNHNMTHSDTGVTHLSGRTVEVVKIDKGESWGPTIVKVKACGEEVWMNEKDLQYLA